jgi:hypothetical protein
VEDVGQKGIPRTHEDGLALEHFILSRMWTSCSRDEGFVCRLSGIVFALKLGVVAEGTDLPLNPLDDFIC